MSTFQFSEEMHGKPQQISSRQLAEEYPAVSIHVGRACNYGQSTAVNGDERLLFVRGEDGAITFYAYPDTFYGITNNRPCGLKMIGQLAEQGLLPADEKLQAVGAALQRFWVAEKRAQAMEADIETYLDQQDETVTSCLEKIADKAGLTGRLESATIGLGIRNTGVALRFEYEYGGDTPLDVDRLNKATNAVRDTMMAVLHNLADVIDPGAVRELRTVVTSHNPLHIVYEVVLQNTITPRQELKAANKAVEALLPNMLQPNGVMIVAVVGGDGLKDALSELLDQFGMEPDEN